MLAKWNGEWWQFKADISQWVIWNPVTKAL